MPDFLFAPTPHTEAIDFIKSKPVVSREVFDNLLPDLRARAFLVTGIESANVVQSIRDRIADLPAGANWDDVKKDIMDELHPYLANDEDPDNMIAADRRAELLIRMHGFQAYQAAQYNVMERQKDVFPYWQYHTMEDDRVRPEHAALDGIVLPADHEFWRHHYPPWNFGCRCQIIPASQSDYEDIQKADDGQPDDQKDILDDYAQRDLTATRRLVRNGVTYNVTAPAESGKPGAFRWNPGDMRIPVEDLRGRYDAKTWADFENNARKQTIPEYNLTVWEWLSGKRLVEPTAPTVLPVFTAKSITEILSTLGLDSKIQWHQDDVATILAALKKPGSVKATTMIDSIGGNALKKSGIGSRQWVQSQVQSILDLIPPDVASALPKMTVKIVRSAGGAFGDWNPVTKTLRVAYDTIKKKSFDPTAQLHETLWHETMHWIHMHGPQSYRDAIKLHFQDRTAGEAVAKLPGYNAYGKQDKWWDVYAGAQYLNSSFDTYDGVGIEVPTRYFQLMANPAKLVRQMDVATNPNAGVFLDTLKIILEVFTGAHK